MDSVELTVFGQIIQERGWRYQQFLREFERAAAALKLNLSVTRKQFDRWRYGQLRGYPRADSCRTLEHMFQISVEELFSTGSATTDVLQEEDDMRRRTMLRGLVVGTGVGVSASGLEVMARARQRMDACLDARSISSATLERWELASEEYAGGYQVLPPHELLADVIADLTDLQQLLEQPHPVRHRQRLCRVTAQFAILAGIFASALGEYREARNWFHTGRLAAAEAGDTRLEGTLAVRSATASLYYGVPSTAYARAVEARTILGDNASPSRVRALLVEARALARMGRTAEALPLLRQAEDDFGRLSPDECSNTAFGFTQRQFYFAAGNAWTHLRCSREAWNLQNRALGSYSPDEYLDPCLVRLDRASCLARDGDIVESYHVAGKALLSLPEGHQTGMILKYAQDFSRIAGHGRSTPAGQEFAEILHHVTPRALEAGRK